MILYQQSLFEAPRANTDALRARTCNPERYRPEEFGAKCDKCFLRQYRQGKPVPPEVNPDARIVVAAEAPGRQEAEFGRPLIGDSGQETMQGLAQLGIRRHDVTWTNAVACRPPDNELDALLLKMKKENKELAANGLEPWLSPIEACRPRFVAELRHYREVLALGKKAIASITGTNQSIMDLRGMPVEGVLDGAGNFHSEAYFPRPDELVTPLRILPTIHPAFVLRQKRHRPTFHVDLARALRWFQGQLQWREPQRHYQPSPDELEYFLLKQRHRFISYDVETDAKEPLVAKLRCVGFGTPEAVMVVGLLSVDGVTRLYDSAAEQAINEIMAACFTAPHIIKSGHNAGYYDRIVIEEQLGVTPAPLVDTILTHRGAASELPHSLGFVGSVFTDVTNNWKGGHTAVTAKTDFELWDYNGTDVVVQARCVEPLYVAVERKGLLRPRDIPGLGVTNVIEIHHQLQAACVGLHRNGLPIDQERRKEHEVRLRRKAELHRQELRYIAGNPDFNPNSRAQLGAILFDKFQLTPERIFGAAHNAGKLIRKAYTKDGEPSTSDDVLRAALLYTQVEEQKAFLVAARKFRGASKLLGTNIIPLRPATEVYQEEEIAINVDTEEGAALVGIELSEEARQQRTKKKHPKDKKGKVLKPGLVLGDGHVHPNWNSHTPTTQRFASSEPNGQNWSSAIRDIVKALHGNLLFSADQDQLELKLAAGLAKAARYLEAFHYGLDPHGMQAELLFGAAFKFGSAKDRKRIRDFTKRFQYLMLYRGTPEKAHEVITSVENAAGDLVYPDVTLKEVRHKCELWLKANPEFISWWDRDLDEYRRTGRLEEPFFGWIREFADGEDENEIANFKCQAGGAAIVHIAMLKLLKTIPFQRWGPNTGLIQQGHDALMGTAPHDGKHHTPEVVTYREDFEEKKMIVWCPEFPPETKTKDGTEIYRRRNCGCTVSQAAHELADCMRVDGRPFGVPVTFTATAKVAQRWSEL